MNTDSIQQNSGNIEKALTVSKGIQSRDSVFATTYINPNNFTQHNLQCGDGIDGFNAFVESLQAVDNPPRVIRVLQDGAFVVTHSKGDMFGSKVFFDIYRFEDGLIVEHWDNLAELTLPNPSGHTPIDGPTEPVNLQDTETNKALVRNFFETIFLNGQTDKMAKYFEGDWLIQHNAKGQDGVGALMEMMRQRQQAGEGIEGLKMEQIIGEGNFVLVTASGSQSGKPVALYDLFRVEQGKIAEHWDVLEEIPPRHAWKNQNGKF